MRKKFRSDLYVRQSGGDECLSVIFWSNAAFGYGAESLMRSLPFTYFFLNEIACQLEALNLFRDSAAKRLAQESLQNFCFAFGEYTLIEPIGSFFSTSGGPISQCSLSSISSGRLVSGGSLQSIPSVVADLISRCLLPYFFSSNMLILH